MTWRQAYKTENSRAQQLFSKYCKSMTWSRDNQTKNSTAQQFFSQSFYSLSEAKPMRQRTLGHSKFIDLVVHSQWAFLGKPFSKPPEASNLIFFAQLNPVCVINALASKNIQLYGPQGPQRALKDPKTGFWRIWGFFSMLSFSILVIYGKFQPY